MIPVSVSMLSILAVRPLGNSRTCDFLGLKGAEFFSGVLNFFQPWRR
jgi:hypothetical protein